MAAPDFDDKARAWEYGSRVWSDCAESAAVPHDGDTRRRGGRSVLRTGLVAAGDRAGALAAYHKAAELFPADNEMAKNERLRENYKYLIEKGLKELGASEPRPKDR